MTEDILAPARIIYEFLQLGHKPRPADLILTLGTNDLRVAEFAADLYHRGFGPRMVITGGIAHVGDLLATSWDRSESEVFADRAIECGVPRERILLETRATNTAENIRFSRAVIEQAGLKPDHIVIAVKPFMQRRTWATMAVEWPEMPASLGSPSMTLDQYFTQDLHPEKIINIMMGDLQRVWIYGARGWSCPQRIPDEVRQAFSQLSEAGFTKHLLKEEA